MSAKATTTAAMGRKKLAQGKGLSRRSKATADVLGHDSQNTSSPEEALEESAIGLLEILLAKREAGFRGRGKYHPPTAPDVEGIPKPPNGWIWASPEQLANAAPYSLGIGPFGSNLKVSDYKETGTPLIFVRNIRAEDFSLVTKYVAEEKTNELVAHTAEGGDILVTKMGEPPGDAAYYPVGAPKAVITADCIKWRLAEDLRVPKFFVYAIRSRLVQQQILVRTRGVAQKKISLERFRDLAIPLPPLPEQRRIVAEIEKQFTRLEAGVAALRRVQANLKRYRAAVLKAACEGQLVPTEAEWKDTVLGEVLVGIEAGRSFKCEERPPKPDEIGVVKVSAVTWGTYDEMESKTCLDSSRVEEKFLVRSDDFLFSRANTIELIGACVIAKKITLRVMLSDKILRFRFSSAVNPSWILYWLRSGFGHSEIERLATGNQNSMRNIGQDRIRQITIKLPPLAEQTRIVAEVERRLSVVEELDSVVSANLQRASRLRQSILQKAFTGELT